MRVLIMSSTLAIASLVAVIAEAGARQNEEMILVVDDSPSRGTLGASMAFPIVAQEEYDPRVRFIEEDLPRPPKALNARLPARGYVRLHNKHDYG